MKINNTFFEQTFLDQMGFQNSKVKTGPAYGVDTSVISISSELDMVCASDPLSYIPSLGPQLSAYLSVHLLANDIITSGVSPQFFQMVLNLPENMSEKVFKAYWKALHLECSKNQISITGGHTGWIQGNQSTVCGGGTMSAIAPKGKFLTSAGAQVGDIIVMTKYAAISSVSILGLQFPKTVKSLFSSNRHFDYKDLFQQISVLPDGLCVAEFNYQNPLAIRAMHDVTEGGVKNAVAEFAIAADLIAEIDLREVPVLEEQSVICDKFDLSPYDIVGAGSLLISVNPAYIEELLSHLRKNKIKATSIGIFKNSGESVYWDQFGQISKLEVAQRDLYWAAYANALNNGWK